MKNQKVSKGQLFKQLRRRALAFVMVFAFLFMLPANSFIGVLSAGAFGIIRNPRTFVDESREEDSIVRRRSVWDLVAFGKYPQDMDDLSGQPIKWRVLAVNGTDAFLMADQALDNQTYASGSTITWGTSMLRTWLNDTFYNTAFTEEEKAAIPLTTVQNPDNSQYNTPGGDTTTDYVYLLSVDEAENAAYGFVNTETYCMGAKGAYPTQYAVHMGAFVDSGCNDRTSWWLRTPGQGNAYGAETCVMTAGGWVDKKGLNVLSKNTSVRPVLHVDLSAACVTDAGTVSSDGTVTEPDGNGRVPTSLNGPRTENNISTWDCVWFGNYPQNISFKTQPILWRVLSVNEDGSDAYVIADRSLDCRKYNETSGAVIWADCSLRTWLNNDFYNAAFTEEEKKLIRTTTVENKDNGDVPGGDDTQDMIYLLSYDDALDTGYGFDDHADVNRQVRFAKPTDYAHFNGVVVRSGYGSAPWWLRSPGYQSKYVTSVPYYGSVLNNYPATQIEIGVRPVMHINLNSELVVPKGTINEGRDTTSPEEEWAKQPFYDAVEAIGTVTSQRACKERIDAARLAYDGLSDELQWKAESYWKLKLTQAEEEYERLDQEDTAAAGSVVTLIEAIGTVTLDDSCNGRISAAEQAYEALTAGAKERVPEEKYKVLTEAKAAYDKLLKEKETAEAAKSETVKKPGKVKLRSVKSTKAGTFTVKWKKVKGAKGYQVSCCVSKKFKKGVKSKTVGNKSRLTVKKLKKGKTYYVRVRAYGKTASGKKVYGSWSKKKKVKIR